MEPSSPLQGAALSKEDALLETVRFAAAHARLFPDQPETAPWLVTSTVLMAQQAAALALTSAGGGVPDKAGATELILRAAAKGRLPAPFTLPFPMAGRRAFDRLVEARNHFMHPRALAWHISPDTLSRGLTESVRIVRYLVLTQPALPDLVSPRAQSVLEDCFEEIEALATFLE